MFKQIVQITAAVAWALICMGGAVFVMALLLGQSLDGIEGQWQIILLIGQVVLLLAVGIAAFQSAMRSR